MRPPAAPAPRPARDNLHARPVQDPDPPRPRVPPPAQHPAARRAAQLPRQQLPFDYTPVTVYREHDASKRPPAALPSRCQTKEQEGRTRLRRAHRAVAHQKGQPLRAALTTSAPSVTRTRHYIVILNDRAQLVWDIEPAGAGNS